MTNHSPSRIVRSSSRGQSIVEFALVLPFLVVLVLGVIEVGYALLDSHIVTKLTREGSNLISRDTSLQDAATAMTQHEQPAGQFRQRLVEDDLLGHQEGGDRRRRQLRPAGALPALRLRHAIPARAR